MLIGVATQFVGTMKLLELAPVPMEVVTVIGPLVAPAGTVAVMVVEALTVKFVELMPLKLTSVAPVKLVPVIVT